MSTPHSFLVSGEGLATYTPSMRYLLLEETTFDPKVLEAMANLVAEMFRIEKSHTIRDAVTALVSFFKWTQKAGPQQDSLKRALMAWGSGDGPEKDN